MMDKLISFFSFSQPNVRMVVLGTLLLAGSSAAVGCFTFLRKRSLSGDVVAHSVLPGICLAFLMAGQKNPVVLLTGAFVTGWLSLWLVDVIRRHTRLAEDAALAVSLSVFFGLGIVLLTMIQQSGNAGQAGLDRFLFGKAAAMLQEDVIAFGALAFVLLVVLLLFFKEFTLLSFDPDFAKATGMPVRFLEWLLTTLTVLAVVTGIQAVGVVLMAALLITPAAAARFWTDDIRRMVRLAALFGALSGLAGSFVSYAWPAMPTGPWMVVMATAIAAFSGVFAPRRGILSRFFSRMKNRRRIIEENILKAFFHLGESDGQSDAVRTMRELRAHRKDLSRPLLPGLFSLVNQGFLQRESGGWKLTESGILKGRRITRLHRLWELYLSRYLGIPDDHVHEDAETIEHFLTPDLERELEQALGNPDTDPHGVTIPGK